MDDFEGELERMWLQVKPLYQNLHAYVRRRLATKYADHEFPSSGHIPAHIMGISMLSYFLTEIMGNVYEKNTNISVFVS